MALQDTRTQLVGLLADNENKVIALTGKWGTGKTHLWQEVQSSANDELISSAVYLSLFGLRNMEQLKLKILEVAIARKQELKNITHLVGPAKRFLAKLTRKFDALDELALLAVPTFLRGKLIVLDDVERKHAGLSLDEILGLIDEFTQRHGARFLLVLNSDQLSDFPVWHTLREKVVDQEVRLDTTPAEAFDIAIALTPSRFDTWIKRSVDTCGITNIRIICRIIKAVNTVTGTRDNLDDAVLGRIIPSITLLAAINYRGIYNGPDFDFVLSLGKSTKVAVKESELKELPQKVGQEEGWRLMLHELGILASDEFEPLVIDFLQSGLIDVDNVSRIIDQYIDETDKMKAREQAHQLSRRIAWDFRSTDAELLQDAENLLPIAHLLDPYIVSDLNVALSEIPGGSEVGEAIVAKYLEAFRELNLAEINDSNPFDRPLHPSIRAEFERIEVRSQSSTTIYDACMHIMRHSAWGPRQKLALGAATPEDFEATIRSLNIDSFRSFMRQMMHMRSQRQMYDQHFGSATDNFVAACRNIAADPASGRLGKIIRDIFASFRLSDDLLAQ